MSPGLRGQVWALALGLLRRCSGGFALGYAVHVVADLTIGVLILQAEGRGQGDEREAPKKKKRKMYRKLRFSERA